MSSFRPRDDICGWTLNRQVLGALLIKEGHEAGEKAELMLAQILYFVCEGKGAN